MCEGLGEEVRGLRSTSSLLKNSHGNVKYSIRKGVAKELVCMIHGHEQWCRDCLRERRGLHGGGQGKMGKIRTTIIA